MWFLNRTCVPVRILINKLDLVPNLIVAGLVGMLQKGRGLDMGESYIPVVCFDPLLHRFPVSPCRLSPHGDNYLKNKQ